MTPTSTNDEFATWPTFTVASPSNNGGDALYIAYLNSSDSVYTLPQGWIAPEFISAWTATSVVTFTALDATPDWWYLNRDTQYVFAIYSLPAAAPVSQPFVFSTGGFTDLTFVASDFSRTTFSPLNLWSGGLYGPLAVDPSGNIYIRGNLNAYPFTPILNTISIITPGNALPTQSLSVPLPSGSYGVRGVYVDKSGSIYSWGGLPNFIEVFPANSRDTAQPSRTIDGSTWPFTIDRIVTDSTGRIYMLTNSGYGVTDGLAILPANATGSVQAQVVPSLTLASTALAVDSHDRIYAIDGAVASQIDVGAVDQSGNFQLIGSLSNQRICCPRLLLVDSNDNLVVPERNELDEFPFGSLGDVAPSIVQSVPPQPDLWTDAVFLPQTVPLPSPPPSSYITLSPDSVSLSTNASSTAQVTASEPGYSGQFQIGSSSCLDENADPHTFALVSPQSGTTFTVSAPTGDLPGYCGISVDDSLGHRASLTVQVSN